MSKAFYLRGDLSPPNCNAYRHCASTEAENAHKAATKIGGQIIPQDHEFTGSIATASGCLSIYAVGMSAGIFLAISFVLCVGLGLTFPTMTMYQAWLPLLPGFDWISLSSFFIGLVEALGYG